jgi:ANTAR domain
LIDLDRTGVQQTSPDVIHQATGVLVERFNITPDAALGLLTRLAQRSETAMVEVSRRLVEVRTPPTRQNAPREGDDQLRRQIVREATRC